MKKILFVDTETTGLDPKINGIHQVAGQLVIDGKLEWEFDFKFKPLPTEVIEDEALAVSNLTREDLDKRPLDSGKAYRDFNKMICNYVNKFDKNDKAVIAGYNCGFDSGFLNQWFAKNGNKYFFGLFHGGAYLDGLQLALMLEIKQGKRIFFPDRKLTTVAKHLGIDTDNAHDALADVIMTRNVIRNLWGAVVK